MPSVTSEVAYLLLIFGLMVIPRALQRFRIPAPLTSFGLGMVAAMSLATFTQDETLALLATLGISSLFLFAGLEIDLDDLRRGKWPLLGHLVVRSILLAAVGYGAVHFFGFAWQVAALLALALLTPSTGFILDTLSGLGLKEEERYWVMIKAVGGELLALLLLFVVLQSGSAETMALSSVALLAMIVGLPLLFMLLGRIVAPHAPGSEFSLLVMVGVIAAYLTYQLGVYYLMGAFLAGFTARLLHRRLPALASDENLHAIQMFASFFVPFYFFHRGLNVPTDALTWKALGLGLLLTAATLPLRTGSVWLQRRFIPRREFTGQPARSHRIDAHADLHAGAGHHPARAVPDFRHALWCAAGLRRRFDHPAIAGAGQGNGFRRLRRASSAGRINPRRACSGRASHAVTEDKR